MKHLELKKQLLETTKPKFHGQINKALYRETLHLEELKKQFYTTYQETKKVDNVVSECINITNQNIQALCQLLDEHFTEVEEIACGQLNAARRNRALRLRKYIEAMRLAFPKIYFVTLTFSDEFIDSKDETKRDHVKRCLHKYSPYYIANVDYGKQFGRLHYHCITTEFIKPKMWKFGSVKTKLIKDTPTDRVKVSKYAVKYSNHALKETNKTQKCLYSKQLKQLLQSISI